MKIAINTLSITPERGGTKTYLTNLVRSLSKIDKTNEYYLFLTHVNTHLFKKIKNKNFKRVIFPLYSDNKILRVFLEQLLIPIYVRKFKIDVLLSPGNVATLFSGCKQVLVVQGLGGIRQKFPPHHVSRFHYLYYNLMVPWSVKKADKVIAVSEDLKKWILRLMPIDESKVKVVYEGVDLGLTEKASKNEDEKYVGPYILFLSTLFKYKNADKLLRAFIKLKKEYNIPHSLMIVGRDPGNETEYLKRLASKENVDGFVVFKGPISHEEVGILYKNADVFVFPSRVESFGLPVLEAMACGTPVVASNMMSVPEVVGDAGIIVDPDDIDSMAEAIYRVLTDDKLRNELIQKGYERVKEFSWKKTAEETLKIFKEIMR